MAKTNAERQSEYRARHLKDVDGTGQRLSVILDQSAKLSLERLAFFNDLSQKEMLQKLIQKAENRLLKKLESSHHNNYFDKIKVNLVTE